MRHALLLALLAGCATSTSQPVVSRGGMFRLSESGFDVVDPDRGSLLIVRDGGVVGEVALGGSPARMVQVDGRTYVTLRSTGEIVEIGDGRDGREVIDRAHVGAEPYGIQASPDGETLYVALAQEDAVIAVDRATLHETARWEISGQPRWIAIEPGGGRLWAASSYGGTLRRIDLEDGTVEDARIPPVYGFSFTTGTFDTPMTLRLTGDLEVTEDGEVAAAGVEISDQESGGYAINDTDAIAGRFNTVAIQFAPDDLEGMVRLVTPTGDPLATGESNFVRGYPTGIFVGPDKSWYMPLENAGAIVATPMNPKDDGVDASGLSEGFRVAPSTSIATGLGPRSVAFADGRLYAYTFLDREVRTVSLDDVATAIDAGTEVSAARAAALGPSGLSADLEVGRDLFYAAGDGAMSAAGRGASCSTCHFDGRNDGLTWLNPDGIKVQTPTLLESASTGPYTWAGTVDSIADEAMITSVGRLGGHLGDEEAALVQAYIATFERIQRPDIDSARVQRGMAAFASAGCTTCHSGPSLTDGDIHGMFGLATVNTPSLVNVGSTAPYLHDGSMATLGDVVRTATEGLMGPQVSLTDAEIADIVAYLKTL